MNLVERQLNNVIPVFNMVNMFVRTRISSFHRFVSSCRNSRLEHYKSSEHSALYFNYLIEIFVTFMWDTIELNTVQSTKLKREENRLSRWPSVEEIRWMITWNNLQIFCIAWHCYCIALFPFQSVRQNFDENYRSKRRSKRTLKLNNTNVIGNFEIYL